jgi:hypothetical protein
MKKSLVLFLGLTFIQIYGFPQTAREICDKATSIIERNATEMVSTLQILDDKGRVRTRKMAIATRDFNGVAKTMIRFLEPADVRGTAMLIFDYKDKPDDLWIFLPALRKERRIVSDEKSNNFMGSEFSNTDLSVPEPDNFEYRIVSSETLEGKICWKIEVVCRNDRIAEECGYSKRLVWIEKESYLTWKTEFYDFQRQLHKVQRFSDYKMQPEGKFFAFNMEKENTQNGRKSVMTVEKFSDGSSLPENAFAPSMMSK